MATVIANTMYREFQDEQKATSQLLSSLNKSKSVAVITEERRKAGLSKVGSNIISKSLHAQSI
eukprot:9479039-Ditylum_brightwellii.AAC.1